MLELATTLLALVWSLLGWYPGGLDADHDDPPRVLRYGDWLAVRSFPVREQMTAARVLWCETRGLSDDEANYAVGAAGERGRWQIHPIHHERFAAYDLTDPAQAGLVAFILWQERGWSVWACSNAMRRWDHVS